MEIAENKDLALEDEQTSLNKHEPTGWEQPLAALGGATLSLT